MRRAGLLILVVVTSLAYLGLAILARGGPTAFFAHPPLTLLALALLAMMAAALLSQGNLSPGLREDRANRWIIWAALGLSVLSAVLPAWSDRTDLLTIDGEPTRWLGLFLFVAGGILRLWPVFVLGRRFSGLVAIQPGHTLVTDGIYAHIRHPSYLGLLISATGWALAFRSLLGLLLVALMVPILLARIRAEEKLLSDQFGQAYDAYRARTWRLLPGLY